MTFTVCHGKIHPFLIGKPSVNVSHGKSPFLIGKPSINGPFSMAMLNNQRVQLPT